MTYEEAVLYLNSFVDYEKKPTFNYRSAFKLERISKLLWRMGDPQKHLKIIHVAGTKGKGSAACFIATILKEQGYRVGLYTSPHLRDFRERIRLLDAHNSAEEKSFFSGMILKNDFAALLDDIKPQVEFFKHSFQNFGSPTFFEILTTMALKYFKDKHADFVVLETGLGGRLDATNAAGSLVSVITPISYDHEHILGHTLPEIAFEKAGIIKSSNVKDSKGVCVAVSAAQPETVRPVLKRRAKSEGSLLLEMGKDFYCKRLGGDLFAQEFYYQGLHNDSLFLKTRMLGDHQLINASVALAACEALSLHGIRIGEESMKQGIWNAFWPGRLEVIRTKPFIILDGAHNRDSAQRLTRFLDKEFKDFRKWIIFGISEDKDVSGIVEQLESVADKVILTRSSNPRAARPETLFNTCHKRNDAFVTGSVEEALGLLNKEIQPDDVAVVTGSLFVVGEARSLCQF